MRVSKQLISGMWSLRLGWGLVNTAMDKHRCDSLVVSGIDHCRIIKFYGEEAEEMNIAGFETETKCLYAANVVHNQVLQVAMSFK